MRKFLKNYEHGKSSRMLFRKFRKQKPRFKARFYFTIIILIF